MSPDGNSFVSIYGNLFKGEPIPENGRLQPREEPGWGVELDKELVAETTTGK
jgi:L-rhamnonate dehydratase